MNVFRSEYADVQALGLPIHKKVRQAEFTGAVPRATSGKILRRELRDREKANEKLSERAEEA
ncbi:hypothetical protein [Streptomyces atratus]|uniref:hypothetical protein n=1 Tax=Streptomyces atratus TaxID=1893 RepID=UPI0033E64F09